MPCKSHYGRQAILITNQTHKLPHKTSSGAANSGERTRRKTDFPKLAFPWITAIGIMAMLLIVGPGCGDNDTIGGSERTGAAPVMFINAGPRTPAIDVYLDQELEAENIERFENSEYISLSPQSYALKITEADAASPLVSTTIPLRSPQFHTVFLNSIGGMNDIVTLVDGFKSIDSTTPDSTTDTAAVRFVNMAADLHNVSLTRPGFDSVLSTEFLHVPTKRASDFERIESGVYTLQLRSGLDGSVLASEQNMTFAAGRVYTVVAVGREGGAVGSGLGIEVFLNFPDQRP